MCLRCLEIHALEDGRLFVTGTGAQLFELNPSTGQRTGRFGLAKRWTVHAPYALCVTDNSATVIDLRSGVHIEINA